MKAFEEWIKTQPAVEDSSSTIPSTQRLASEEIWAEKGWKAALEWVLQFEFDYEHPDEYDEIRKELEQ